MDELPALYECCDTTWRGTFDANETCEWCQNVLTPDQARNAHVMASPPTVDRNVTPEEVSLYMGGLGFLGYAQ